MNEIMSYTKVSLRDTILLYLIFGSCHPAKIYHCKIERDIEEAKQYIGIAFSVFGMCERANKNVQAQSEQCKSSPYTLLFYDNVKLENIILQNESSYLKIVQFLKSPYIEYFLDVSFDKEIAQLIGKNLGDLISHLKH